MSSVAPPSPVLPSPALVARSSSASAETPSAEPSDLRDKSSRGSFGDAELVAGESLAALAVADPDERLARLRSLRARRGPSAVSTSARMRPLLSKPELAVIDAVSTEAPATAIADPARARIPDEATADVESDEPVLGNAGRGKALTAAGLEAIREQRFDAAQRLFAQALALDSRNARALAGLAEVHFERGSYRKAVDFAERATKRAPRNGTYRILLGDAYFKTLAFNGARREYERARELGNRKADARLRQLATEMGN